MTNSVIYGGGIFGTLVPKFINLQHPGMPESPGKTNEIPAFAGMTSLRMGKLFK